MGTQITAAAKTHVGKVRRNNEDCFRMVDEAADRVDVEKYGRLFAVADGMGGHEAGEVASRMACEGLKAYYDRRDGDCEDLPARLEDIFGRIHENIQSRGSQDRRLSGMGTTLSVLVLKDDRALIAHVGDSRIYRLRKGKLEQLTRDHTQVQMMVEMGRLTPEEAAESHMRHVLTQALGGTLRLHEVFLQQEELQPEDVFVLCSDGLHDMLDDTRIRDTVLACSDADAACDALVDAALEAGGKDNITVVVVRVGRRHRGLWKKVGAFSSLMGRKKSAR